MIRLSYRLTTVLLSGAMFFSRARAQEPNFGARIDMGLIEFGALSEVSGLAASRKNHEVLWAHNDSGDRNRVYALNVSGKHLGVFTVASAEARDWEDLALGPGPQEGQDYLYIGDLGDNSAQYDLKRIYRVPEPQVAARQAPVELTLSGTETITVQYPDGKRDAETLMLDSRTKDLYVVSKREANVRVYRAAYPQSTSETITLEAVASLPFGGVVAGDISRAGDEILIKTYDAIYYWKRTSDQTVAQALAQAPVKVPYLMEPLGEAVCWHEEAKGYYTLSEEFQNIPAHLYFYPRLLSTGAREESAKPSEHALLQNYPNPFNPTTTISFFVPQHSEVSLRIFDLGGREVAQLVEGRLAAGRHEVQWRSGNCGSGIYLCRLRTGEACDTRKLTLVR